MLQVDVEEGYSNLVLNKTLRAESLSVQDNAFVSTLFYGVLERRLTLDWVILRHSRVKSAKISQTTREILRMGIYQLLYMDKVPPSAAVNESVKLAKRKKEFSAAGFINGVLRSVSRCEIQNQKQGLDFSGIADPLERMSVEHSVSVDIIQKWRRDYPNDAEGLINSLFVRKPVVIRTNTLKIASGELAELLGEEGIAVRLHPLLPNALVLEKSESVEKLSAYRNGLFHVQGAASQLCCMAVGPQPGEKILDLCAAPGGKSFTLAQDTGAGGRVTSLDIHQHRVELIARGSQRLDINSITTGINDASHKNEGLRDFDRVLCDVPCSGLGVISKKPEIRYKFLTNLDKLTKMQYLIISNAADSLKRSGRLIYSTCTLNRAENEDIINAFLADNPGFEPEPLPSRIPLSDRNIRHMTTLMPHRNNTDGFFIASLKKNEN